MRPINYTTSFFLILISLVGCSETREPRTVDVRQQNDKDLSCRDIEVEYKANSEIATNKISKNNSDDTKDIILGVLIWPGLVDFKNADGIEGNAVLDRNIFLRELAIQRKCEIQNWPFQPKRYTYELNKSKDVARLVAENQSATGDIVGAWMMPFAESPPLKAR